MSHALLASFDPFKAHPFTSGGTPPPKDALPIIPPSSSIPNGAQQPAAHTIAHPQPRRSPNVDTATPSEPVFMRFELDRRTPDLVVKKAGGAWGGKAEAAAKR